MNRASLKNSAASVLILFAVNATPDAWTNSYLKAALLILSAILLCYFIFSGPNVRTQLINNNDKDSPHDQHKNVDGNMPCFKGGAVLAILGLILSAAYPEKMFSGAAIWLSIILLAYSIFFEKKPPKIFAEYEFERLGQLQLAIFALLGACFIFGFTYMLKPLDIFGYVTLTLAAMAVCVAICMLTYVVIIFLKAKN